MYVCMYACMCTHVYVYAHVKMYAYAYAHLYMYAYVYVPSIVSTRFPSSGLCTCQPKVGRHVPLRRGADKVVSISRPHRGPVQHGLHAFRLDIMLLHAVAVLHVAALTIE